MDKLICYTKLMPLAPAIVITDWAALTTISGSWTTNTSYVGTFTRINDSMLSRVTISLVGAPDSTALTLNIPNGETVDETKLPSAGNLFLVGSFFTWDDDVTTVHGGGQVYYNSTTNLLELYIATTAPNTFTAVSETSPITYANGDYLSIEFSVPISGW